ncbi:MAG: SDR family oxidoreductase [Proteobacteria bacterium]|nr:SDR family oxidoreductase [Pseudomonadota bacterium]
MDNLRGVVLVTGASSGFGRAIAADLSSRGWDVWAASRQPQPMERCRTLVMDVRSDASVAEGVARIQRESGRIDALVNNAGYGIAGAIEDTTEQEAWAQLDTNFIGMHRVCRAVLPGMRTVRSGRIVNMSSLGGLVALPFQAFYAASKFSVEAYTEALRMELAAFGIKVSMVEPGDFATGFTASRKLTGACAQGSPYFETAARAIARAGEDEQKMRDISPVVRAVSRALESRSPRLRYPVASTIQRFLVGLRPVLPQSWFEYLIMDNYRMR